MKKKSLRNLTMAAKRANRRAWIKALRSGEYKQTWGRLCEVDPDGDKHHCCLGVACEVLLARGYAVKAESDGAVVRFNGSGGGLKPQLMAAVGIDDDTHDSCVGWNDVSFLSFKRIATRLEKLPIK